MNKLFDAFEGVSAKAWKQKIQVDLKGADYNDTLVWQSAEGIDVKPFYHPDDFEADFEPVPGHPDQWQIVQQVFIDEEAVAHQIALMALKGGAESLRWVAHEAFDIKALFKDLPLDGISCYFELSFWSVSFIKELTSYLSSRNVNAYFCLDPLGQLAASGNWFNNQKQDLAGLQQLLIATKADHLIGIDGSLYQNAGANGVQQLAYMLAHANEYIESLPAAKLGTPTFRVAVGSNYFFEIAKLRALRKLWASLADAHGLEKHCHILAVPTLRDKSLYDYNVNMLRTTTQCMSAVLGGANGVCNLPYDYIYHKSNDFGERIARNQLLVLKAESYFDATANAADGTYYIESLTEQLAEKALSLFKELEASGGYLQGLMKGSIQRKIKESGAKEQALFDDGELVMIGTNKYPNPQDRMKEDLQLYPFVKFQPRKTLIEPIIAKRIAESNEKIRLENEEN